MRTTMIGIGLTGLLAALLVTVLPLDAAEVKHRGAEWVTRVYAIADMPVWSIEEGTPQFNPTVLVAHIKSSVDAQSWEKASIRPYERDGAASLVIRQTRSNHEKIAQLLTSLRPEHPNEEIETIDAAENFPCEQ